MNGRRETAHPAVATYVSAVRDELGDLPPDELADIAEDVRDHLDQVAAEFGDGVSLEALIDRLGAPAGYAAELRAAAGFPEPEPEPAEQETGFARRLLRFMVASFGCAAAGFTALAVVDVLFGVSGAPSFFAVPAAVFVVAATACVFPLILGLDDPAEELRQIPGAGQIAKAERWMRARPWGEPAIEFVRSLRPAWWVARAGALGLVVAYFFTTPLGGVVFLAGLVGSVLLGRKTTSGEVGGRGLLGVHVANVALAVGGVLVAASVLEVVTTPSYEYVEVTGAGNDSGSYTDAGTPVTNIFAYGPDGRLLTDVRLYDQDGNPIELVGATQPCYDGAFPEETFVHPNPWGAHVFPRLTVEADESGRCLEPELKPPFGVQLPDAGDAGQMAGPDATLVPEATAVPEGAGEAVLTGPVPSTSTPTPAPNNGDT